MSINTIDLRALMMTDVKEGYIADIHLSHMCACTSALSSLVTIADVTCYSFQSGGNTHFRVGK